MTMRSSTLFPVLATAALGCASGGGDLTHTDDDTYASSSEHVVVEGSGGSVRAIVPHVAQWQATNAEMLGLMKPQDPQSPQVQALDPTTKTRRWLATRPADELVELSIRHDAAPVTRAELDGDRAALAESRLAMFSAHHEAISRTVVASGGRVVGRHWLLNDIDVELRADAAVGIVDWAASRGALVFYSEGGMQPKYTMDAGQAKRADTRSDLAVALGWTGAAGGQATGKIRVGIVDGDETSSTNANWPAWTHVGYSDTPGGATRWRAFYSCDASSCTAVSSPPVGIAFTHSVEVSAVTALSIEEGQDSAITANGDRIDRSGESSDTSLTYFHIRYNDWCTNKHAYEKAVVDRIDVLEQSVGQDTCDVTFNPCGVSDFFSSMLDANVVMVNSAGNEGQLSGCTVDFPGWRPEWISAGGAMYSSGGNWNNAGLGRNYGVGSPRPVTFQTSAGPISIGTYPSGTAHSAAGVSMLGHWSHFLEGSSAPAAYSDTNTETGSSLSAGEVAGAVALFKNAFFSNGLSLDARYLTTNFFLNGDAWNGVEGSGSADLASGVSNTSGFGRLHMHYPAEIDMGNFAGGPWGWGWHKFHINSGTLACSAVGGTGPEPSAVTMWRGVGTWFERDLTHVSDVDFYLRDYSSCPATPSGSFANVTYQSDYDFRARLQATSGIAGKCLWFCAYGFNVPAAGVDVYMADWFHSNNPADY